MLEWNGRTEWHKQKRGKVIRWNGRKSLPNSYWWESYNRCVCLTSNSMVSMFFHYSQSDLLASICNVLYPLHWKHIFFLHVFFYFCCIVVVVVVVVFEWQTSISKIRISLELCLFDSFGNGVEYDVGKECIQRALFHQAPSISSMGFLLAVRYLATDGILIPSLFMCIFSPTFFSYLSPPPSYLGFLLSCAFFMRLCAKPLVLPIIVTKVNRNIQMHAYNS